MTWPVVGRLSTHLAGGRDDLWVHQWTFWWIRQALREGLNPFYTPYLYFPDGVSLTSHNIAWFNIALWLPLQAIFGRVTAYNLVFLIVIALNGFCMYLFAYLETRSRISAFVAGLIFGFWPYTLSHYDHANMMVLFWVPLSLTMLHHLITQSDPDQSRFRWAWLAAAAISIAMIGITRWQLLIMSSPLLIAYTLYLLSKQDSARRKRTLLQLLIVVTLAIIIMAPLAAPLLVDQFTRDFPADVFLDEPQWGRTDLLAYFIPSIHNGIWQDFVAGIYENFVVNQFYTPYLGFLPLLLAVVGLLRRWSKTWFWLILFLFTFTLALGPVLAINGREFARVPMPYRLVEDFILLRLLRRPDRLNIFLSLPLAMMVAWGIESLLAVVRSARLRNFAIAISILLILFAYSPIPFATTKPEVPSWYAQVGADGEETAFLDLPMNDRSYDKWYMQYQTEHEQPLATGHVSRLPAEAHSFLASTPLFHDLRQRDQLPDPSLTRVTEELAPLHEAGVRYLVLHKAFANDGLLNAWRDWLTFSPLYEDEELVVFRTKPTYGQDFDFASALTPQIGLIDIQLSPNAANQAGTISVDARWGTTSKVEDNLDVCLLMIDPSMEIIQSHCLAPDPWLAVESWPANDVRRSSHIFPVGHDVPAGPYQLAIALAAPGTTDLVGKMVVIDDIFVHPYSPTHVSTAVWQDEIQLAGYDLEQNESEVVLTLFWQALRPVDSSYKVFVHLADKETGEIIAQTDSVPRDWRYPTTNWKVNEVVRDVISVPLPNALLDTADLRLGFYDELTGKRIPVISEGSAEAKDHFLLDTIQP
jgi:hypothetical protein